MQIGVDARGEPHRLTIGRGAVHHALVGGDVQMGKSNLLQVMITQLALRYPPDELEMYLLDFKQVEFHSYLTHGLPHARAIASHADREFGLSVLRQFRSEIDRRSELFQRTDVEHLRDYRRVTSQRLPRSLVVMDEFQALFPEHDQLSTAAGFLLEDIAKRGAAFGMHLLMCSQAPTSGQVGTYLRPMYEQMGLRIALGCQSPNVSYAILGEGNDAATKLRRPGDAVYNDRAGEGKNPVVRIAELPGPERREWLKTINALGNGREFDAPATFHPTSPAHLIKNPACAGLLAASEWPGADGNTIHVWLGEPVEIKAATTATFERYPGSNLLLIADEQAGHALLLSSLLSVAVQRSPVDVCFVLAEFARPTSPFHGFFAPLNDKLPHTVDVAGPRAAAGALDKLVQTMTNRAENPAEPHPALFFFIAGMHRWRELAPQDRFERSPIAKQLAQLADEGPELGIHIVAWADSYATVERALQRGALNLFDQRAVLRVPSDTDSMALLGTPAAIKLPDNRALFRVADWEAGRVEKFKPYSLPALDPFELLKARVNPSAPQHGAKT